MRHLSKWILLAAVMVVVGCGTTDVDTGDVKLEIAADNVTVQDVLPDATLDLLHEGILDVVEATVRPDALPELETVEPDIQPDLPPEEDIVIDVDPGDDFDRFCRGEDWDAKAVATTLGKLTGTLTGWFDGGSKYTLEVMKVIPQHPFYVEKIRVGFGGGAGKARIHLMHTFGRSYPANYPVVDEPDANLMPPVDLEVYYPDAEDWVEIDVAAQGIFLEPTQHYMIVYQHFDAQPYLAIESLPEGEISRALILIPSQFEPWGLDGNFRMELTGSYFCEWNPEDHWFEEDMSQPFVEDGSSRPQVADLNGDGHDDIVLMKGGLLPLLGDGEGHFIPPEKPLFPEGLKANMAVMADLDNDGDTDAFLPIWVGGDGDVDGFMITEGDCNDKDAAINPDAEEIPDNGQDDDCDGVADDGEGSDDLDEDGFTISEGDCNDNLPESYPGGEEIQDGLDNDCDLLVDEDFVNTIWLNEGADGFVPVENSGVETLDPTGAAALGDSNADGILDIYWGNWLKHYPDAPSVADVYVVGHGDGTYTDVTVEAGMVPEEDKPCYGVSFNDFNNDGQQDVWVGNYQLNPNFMYVNNGDGTFVDLAEELNLKQDAKGAWGGHSYGGDWGDFDNDGDLDLFVPNLSHPRTMPYSDTSQFMVNQGGPNYDFVDKRKELGLIYDEGDVNAAFGDFDNDMDLDLVVIALYPNHYSKFYRNDGEAGFTDITYETLTAVHDSIAANWADVDEDGDLDLFISDRHGVQRAQLFVNRVGQDLNWVQFVLEGTQTNRSAIGARVTLAAGGVTQMREVKGGGRHMNAQDSLVVHFGLAELETVDEITVRWVGGGTESIDGISPNTRYHVVEGSGTATPLW